MARVYRVSSKGRAATVAALSLSLALGGLAVVPATVLAADGASATAASEPQDVHRLTVSVRCYPNASPAAEVIQNLRLTVTDAQGKTYPLTQGSGIFSFQYSVNGLVAGDYKLSATGLDHEWRMLAADEKSDLDPSLTQVSNGSTITIKKEDDFGTPVYLKIAEGLAKTHEPTVETIEAEQNTTPAAAAAISNKDELPEGTTYEWQTAPDTSTPGSATGTVKVVYSDGTYDTAEVSVTVTPAPDPATDPETKPATDPETKPVTGPETDPATDPFTKPATTSPAAKSDKAATTKQAAKARTVEKNLPETGDPASIAAVLATGLGGLGVAAEALIHRKRY